MKGKHLAVDTLTAQLPLQTDMQLFKSVDKYYLSLGTICLIILLAEVCHMFEVSLKLFGETYTYFASQYMLPLSPPPDNLVKKVKMT